MRFSFTACEQALERRVTEAADAFIVRAYQNPSEQLWLWYTPARGDEACGKLFPAADRTGGIEQLAHPEHIPSNLDRGGVRAWIRARVGHIPILNPN